MLANKPEIIVSPKEIQSEYKAWQSTAAQLSMQRLVEFCWHELLLSKRRNIHPLHSEYLSMHLKHHKN